MTTIPFLECTAAPCAFRFPVLPPAVPPAACPRCGAPVRRTAAVPRPPEAEVPRLRARPRGPLAALLDNLRSAYNVGAAFRIADGAGLAHLFLVGFTPTPAHRGVAKTALGAEEGVPWSHHPNGVRLARRLREAGWTLWALETAPDALSPFELDPGTVPFPLILVVGNEVVGIDPELRALCAQTLALPMAGRKGSLNSAVALGIALYALAYGS